MLVGKTIRHTTHVGSETSGGYGAGVPPLPIPNREVKPSGADGTAMQCGRVGSRLLSKERSPRIHDESSGFLLVVGHRALVFFVWYMALCLL